MKGIDRRYWCTGGLQPRSLHTTAIGDQLGTDASPPTPWVPDRPFQVYSGASGAASAFDNFGRHDHPSMGLGEILDQHDDV